MEGPDQLERSRYPALSRIARIPAPLLGFLPWDGIHLMPYSTDTLVYNLAHAIERPERPVLWQCVPRAKRKILTKPVLLRCIEILHGNVNSCHFVERGFPFIPFSHGVFDAHGIRSFRLHQKFHGYITFLERVTHRVAEIILTWIVWHRIYCPRDGLGRKFDGSTVRSDP